MKIVTINIPDQYLDCIETLVKTGFFPSRSEAIREALKQFLQHEKPFQDGIKNDFYHMKQAQMEKMF